MPILEGPSRWEAMSGGVGGDARPNNGDEKYGRGDRAQNDVVLRNVGGGKKGSGSVEVHRPRGSFDIDPSFWDLSHKVRAALFSLSFDSRSYARTTHPALPVVPRELL